MLECHDCISEVCKSTKQLIRLECHDCISEVCKSTKQLIRSQSSLPCVASKSSRWLRRKPCIQFHLQSHLLVKSLVMQIFIAKWLKLTDISAAVFSCETSCKIWFGKWRWIWNKWLITIFSLLSGGAEAWHWGLPTPTNFGKTSGKAL